MEIVVLKRILKRFPMKKDLRYKSINDSGKANVKHSTEHATRVKLLANDC